MSDTPFTEIPLPPQYHPKDTLSSQSTSSQVISDNQSSEFDKTQDFCVATSQYLIGIKGYIADKMMNYERKTEEIDKTIHREQLLEQAVRTLKSTMLFLHVLLAFFIVFSFSILLFIALPDTNFIKQNILTSSIVDCLGALGFFAVLIKGYIDLKSYSSRMDALEKKINSNCK